MLIDSDHDPKPLSNQPSHRRALLLNSSYEPMLVLNWQKALILWLQDKAEVLEYHDLFIYTVKTQFRLPSVLRLKNYVRPRRAGTVRFSRENVYIRDDFTCQYCGKKHSPKSLTLDHVIPASQSGPKTWSNVVAACQKCNQTKANRTPKQAKMPLLSEPKMPSWLPTSDIEMKPEKMPSNWLQYLRFQAG